MNRKHALVSAGTVGAALLPLVAFAQGADLDYFDTTIGAIQDIVNALVPLLTGVALVVFIWGVIRYVTAGESDEKKAQARGLMIYGVIALFVIVSVWGLVNVLQDIVLGGTGDTSVESPNVPN